MSWLSNLSIKSKMALMLFFPISGLLYFSFIIVMDKYRLVDEMNKIDNLAAIAIQTAEVIHQLQHERFTSVAFLKHQDNQFVSELTEERLKSDEQVTQLKIQLKKLPVEKLDKTFQTHVKQVLGILNNLSIQHEAIFHRNLNELETINLYSEINATLIGFVKQIATLTTDKNIFTLELVYSFFLAKTELAAQKRSMLINVSEQKSFEREKFFLERVAKQQLYLQLIEHLVTDEQKAFFDEEIQKMRESVNVAANEAILEQSKPAFWSKIQNTKIDVFKRVGTKLSDDLRATTLKIQHHAKIDFIITVSIVLIVLILTILFVIIIVKKITTRLGKAVDVANAIAAGNLNSQIDVNVKDETGQLLQAHVRMQNQLQNILTVIARTVEVVNQAAQDISQGNSSLNQRTEEQAASLEETAASMEQMTGTVQQNADNAKLATQLAVSARDRAKQGGDIINATIISMTEISQSSEQITDIISVIDEIAFQTNLLALNAAVEAARAGEQGRGFAVVASEVRNLAQRSATAAKEIKGLIADSVAKVEEGTKLADKSGETLRDIVMAVTKVSDIIAEIAAASQEQSSGINQVNRVVSQMDEMIQQNAVLVEQAATASNAMIEQVQILKKQMAFFKIKKPISDLSEVNSQSKSLVSSYRSPNTVALSKRSVQPFYQDDDWKDF
jgi:methyl-accepting chemotaxis protein